MTKVSIKVVSVVLCAVMVVGCCFTGCDKEPELTLTKILESIKDEFPKAHIGLEPYAKVHEVLFFREDELSSEFLDGEDDFFLLQNLINIDDTKNILSAIMPKIVFSWGDNDTEKLIIGAKPNESFTEWGLDYKTYEIESWRIYACNLSEGMGIMITST